MIVDLICGCAVDVERERPYAVLTHVCDEHNGKQLRDQFAAAALTGLLAAYDGDQAMPPCDRAAAQSYAYADAMLEARGTK